ncbi:unnamed protein product [Orchesella dallaii]|uniref:Uncharacterized protein n=1 Tax=Orchesella dallaii TaxID=48710 RepID=A0ABP1RZB8_9HEXA
MIVRGKHWTSQTSPHRGACLEPLQQLESPVIQSPRLNASDPQQLHFEQLLDSALTGGHDDDGRLQRGTQLRHFAHRKD